MCGQSADSLLVPRLPGSRESSDGHPMSNNMVARADTLSDVGIGYFAARDPGATAIVEPGGARTTRAELVEVANRIGHALVDCGLKAGDRLAIISPNSAEFLAAYFAGIQTGLYVVPVNWRLADAEIAYVLEASRASLVLAHERLGMDRLQRLAALVSGRAMVVVIGRCRGLASLDAFIAGQPATPVLSSVRGRVLAFTSASSGRPKPVRHSLDTSREVFRRTVEWYRAMGIAAEERNVHLCASMLYHCAPLDCAAMALQLGHRVVLVDGWNAESLLRAIARHRVTTSFMVPAMLARLLHLSTGVRGRYSVTSLRHVVQGGAPCPIHVMRGMLDWWGRVIWHGYGATEAMGTIASPDDWLRYPGTAGRPIPGVAVKILDERGKELPAGRIGIIYVSPWAGDRFEYEDDPRGTRDCYRGAYLTVGDLGFVNDEGLLFVCGRRSELIISSGMNIYPAEIEQVLARHPLVVDCAVSGEPHELLGEVPIAFVQLDPDVEPGPDLTLNILRFVARELSTMKLPKRIEYLSQIPRDPNGKLHRSRLPSSLARPDVA